MWAILTSLLGGYWKWILGAVVALGIGTAVWAHFNHVHNLETQVLTLNTELSTAIAANQAAKADYDRSTQQQKTAYNQALKERDAASQDAAQLKDTLNAIANSPPGDDGPIAPVLKRTLDSLYGP